jgi:hypothetical protein
MTDTVPTQADRECAAKFGWPETEVGALVQAFARHRHEAELRGIKLGLEAAAVAMEADAKLCDCFARSEGECGCGAWGDYKTVPVERMVELIRALDPAAVQKGS